MIAKQQTALRQLQRRIKRRLKMEKSVEVNRTGEESGLTRFAFELNQ